ncbi:MAG: DegT/DnrJ/EryC1/StrS family aminotransferase [Myxococcota bacterium]
MSAERNVESVIRDGLAELTGFTHPVFFQSGTAALEAVLRVLSQPGDRIAVPALGCWTVSYAVTEIDRVPVFCDIDRHWTAQLDAVDASLAITIDSWGVGADWRQARPSLPIIADMTLAPGARLSGRPAADWCVAGIISLGAQKPLSIYGGGVALFRDAEHARDARRLYRFGFRDGQWVERIGRYSFCPHALPALADRLGGLPALGRVAAAADRQRAVLSAAGLSSNPLRDDGSWGHSSYVPAVLPDDFALSPRDIEGVALCAGLPISRHPVAPAYLQPAWADRPRGSCPRAEELAPRCLLSYTDECDAELLCQFIAAVMDRPERFRTPFPLPAPTGQLSADLEKMASVSRLVRDLDGRYGLVSEADNLMWPVDEREAAIIQARFP